MVIDSRTGGLGDAWMRLLALYSLSALRPRERHAIVVNSALVPLAGKLFGDRFDVRDTGQGEVSFTHLGVRHIAGDLLRGRRFVFPFHWCVRESRRKSTLRDRANDSLIRLLDFSGIVRLPSRGLVDVYQGYMELQSLRPFHDVSVREFDGRARTDFPGLGIRLRKMFPNPPGGERVVFPSGTAHQVMPVEWAGKHLASAIFAFHVRDSYAEEFYRRGLRIEWFETPEDMLALAAGARQILATDSFPSHLWQVFSARVVLLLSQQPGQRVVHPGFPAGQVVRSRAACCPCRNRERGQFPLCDAGRAHCATWDDREYVATVERMIA